MLRNNRGRPIVTVMVGAGENGNADLLLTDLASVTGSLLPNSYLVFTKYLVTYCTLNICLPCVYLESVVT